MIKTGQHTDIGQPPLPGQLGRYLKELTIAGRLDINGGEQWALGTVLANLETTGLICQASGTDNDAVGAIEIEPPPDNMVVVFKVSQQTRFSFDLLDVGHALVGVVERRFLAS